MVEEFDSLDGLSVNLADDDVVVVIFQRFSGQRILPSKDALLMFLRSMKNAVRTRMGGILQHLENGHNGQAEVLNVGKTGIVFCVEHMWLEWRSLCALIVSCKFPFLAPE